LYVFRQKLDPSSNEFLKRMPRERTRREEIERQRAAH
jgi:hypothetical protein